MQTLSRRLILNLKVRLVDNLSLKSYGNYRTRLQRRGRIEEIYVRPSNISFDDDMLAGRKLLGL